MIPHNAMGSDMPLFMYHVVRKISGSLKPEILLMAVIKDVASLFPQLVQPRALLSYKYRLKRKDKNKSREEIFY